MSVPGENEHSRAALTPEEHTEWHSELDSALADLESRLLHPPRRARDVTPQPMSAHLGQVGLTNELLDEIAWRVSERIRRTQNGVTAPSQTDGAPAAACAGVKTEMPYGISIVIRVRKPLFAWRFWTS